jgi:hypothetical protein
MRILVSNTSSIKNLISILSKLIMKFQLFYAHNRVVHKLPKMGLLGLSFAKSIMGSQDENSAHRGKNRGPN